MAQSEPVTPADEDAPVVRDEAYYAEVLEAVGRGAPTLLLGTSTRSLARSVKRLQEVQSGSSELTTQRKATDDIPKSEKRPSRRRQTLRVFLSAVIFCGLTLTVIITLALHASSESWWEIALSAFLILISGFIAFFFILDFWDAPIILERRETRFIHKRTAEPNSGERTSGKKK